MKSTVDTIYITNGITQDGFGARLQRCFQVMCYVYELQSQGISVEYLHTPLAYNEDNLINEDRNIGTQNRQLVIPFYKEASHEEYLERSRLWDVALGYVGKTVYDVDISTIKIKEGLDILSQDLTQGSAVGNLYVVRYLHQEYDTGRVDINLFYKYRERILKNFTIEKRERSRPQVAIHIRRSDAVSTSKRYLSEEYYSTLLSQLEKIKQEYNITIYSQQIGFNLEYYKNWNIVLDVDEYDFDTFKKFIHADHLVVGASSLSYAAALLNDNIVVYHFNGHAALKGWYTVEDYIELINK